MHLTCPSCYAQHSLDAMLELAQSKDVVSAIARVPAGMGPLTLRYLSLFRTQGRAMKAEKAAKLIAELAELMGDATVKKHGRDWVAPVADWRDAIECLLDVERRPKSLTLPLRDNKYLIGILANKANSAEAKAETKRENDRARRTIVGAHASHAPVSPPLPSGESAGQAAYVMEGGAYVPLPTAQPSDLAQNVAALNRVKNHPIDALFAGFATGPVNVRDILPANIAQRMGKPASDAEAHPWLHKPVRILVGQHKGREGTCIEIKANTVVVRIVQPKIGERVVVYPFDQLEVV